MPRSRYPVFLGPHPQSHVPSTLRGLSMSSSVYRGPTASPQPLSSSPPPHLSLSLVNQFDPPSSLHPQRYLVVLTESLTLVVPYSCTNTGTSLYCCSWSGATDCRIGVHSGFMSGSRPTVVTQSTFTQNLFPPELSLSQVKVTRLQCKERKDQRITDLKRSG